MKIPLVIAFCTSWFANCTNCCGSPADAITKSTGKLPPPGRGGGVNGITRIPAIFESGAVDSTSNCCAVFFRSLQGLVTMPPKPPFGFVI